MGGRKRAGRVGRGSISGEQKSLAPAAAEVLAASFASAARLLHPVFAAEFLECRGVVPDLFQRAFADIFQSHSRNHAYRVAMHRYTRWIDQHNFASASAHTRLGILGVV